MIDEIKAAVKKMKINKAPGISRAVTNILNHLPEEAWNPLLPTSTNSGKKPTVTMKPEEEANNAIQRKR